MPNPWDVLPAAAMGDAEPGILFQSIGQALTEWSHIETCYAEIYAIFVGAKGRKQFQTAALRAYGSIPSISTQLILVQYAAEVFFHKHTSKRHLKKTLDTLISDTKEFSGRRNEIAHGQVSQVYIQKSPRSHQMQSVGYFLLPSLYHPKKYKLDSGEITYQYHSSNVIYYRQEFTKLQLRVASCLEQIKS